MHRHLADEAAVDLAPADKFHVSLRCTICMEHWINHLTTNLLTKIHRLVDQSLILEPRLDLSLLKPYSLMILLRHLWKD